MQNKVLKLMLFSMAWGVAVLKAENSDTYWPDWLHATASLELASGYHTEGFLINDEPILRPSLAVTGGDFGLSMSANYDLTDAYYPDGPGFTEVSLGLSYFFDLDPLSFSVGFGEIFYPNTYRYFDNEGEVTRKSEDSAHLFYIFVERDDLPIVPQLTLDYAVGARSALYSKFALKYGKDLTSQLSADLITSVAWANGSYHALGMAPRESGWRDLGAEVRFSWQINQMVFRTSLGYSYLLSDEIASHASEHGYKEPHNVTGTMALIRRF